MSIEQNTLDHRIHEAQTELVEYISLNLPHVDITKVQSAIQFAITAHSNQQRRSGEPYVLHSIAVARLVAGLKLDATTIASALLHDVAEDTDYGLFEIERNFGIEVAQIVDGLSKLQKVKNIAASEQQAENTRKLLLASVKDLRVLIVKLADRLHNMATLHFIANPEKRSRIANETMEIYAPLAERIGLQSFKHQLQELAFAELHPDASVSIAQKLRQLRSKVRPLFDHIVSEISILLQEYEIEANVVKREKTPYSIWSKIKSKKISFEKLGDIFGCRIIVNSVMDCYKALGLVHTRYKMVAQAFHDYISTSKSNGYQSLHTVIVGPTQHLLEIQIRTIAMNDVAELGVAAHWAYKQGVIEIGNENVQLKSIKEIIEENNDALEVMSHVKLEMYTDQVFCFTPNGKIVILPQGAMPLDFAFAIHSEVGLRCTTVKVNGDPVQFETQLANGDVVEIVLGEEQRVIRTWENLVITGKAKSAIKRFLRRRNEMEQYGLHEIEVEPKHEKLLSKLIKKLRYIRRQTKGPASKHQNLISLMESNDVELASCCSPLPGERIIAVPGEEQNTFLIHSMRCKTIEKRDAVFFVSWGDNYDDLMIATIQLTISNESHGLANVISLMTQHNLKVVDIEITTRVIVLEILEMTLKVEFSDKKAMMQMIQILRNRTEVRHVELLENTNHY